MDKQNLTKHYSNGDITIIWKPGMCTHSTKCWKGLTALPEVFNPAERSWIKPEGASSERIIEQIEMCPSKALSWKKNEG